MIEKGGKDILEVKGMTGLTPLGLAAVGGQKKVCELLIEVGANVNIVDIYGESLIHKTMQRNK